MKTILVQMSDSEWTREAMHRACLLARETSAQVVLLRLMQVEHISYLGSDFGYVAMTPHEQEAVEAYAETAEDYGVTFALHQMQCLSLVDAAADSALALEAETLFVHIPHYRIPVLYELRMHHLERRLRGSGCVIYTLNEKPASATWGAPSAAAASTPTPQPSS